MENQQIELVTTNPIPFIFEDHLDHSPLTTLNALETGIAIAE
jgi:hypothetical protein